MITAMMPLAQAASLNSFIRDVLVNKNVQQPKGNKYKNASQ
jgi:hypothetical protein